MKNLGTINGWINNPPKAYTDHLKNCGQTYTSKVWDMEFDADGKYVGSVLAEREAKRYNVTSKRIGRCRSNETCNDCGCSWQVDSSD